MKFDVELVGKIGSMALIAKQAQIPDYTRIARLSGELKPGYIWVTSGATEIGRLDYIRRHGRELEGKMEDVKADYSAEGLPAGELKHGPLALVEEGFPVALLSTVRAHIRKCEAAAAEVAARGGRVALFSQYEAALSAPRAACRIRLPAVAEPLMPAVAVIPLQYFACRLCSLRGLDPDRPRNLAKSVTVE